MTHAVGPVSAHLDEAAEEQPALAHSGRLHKVELPKLKVLSMDFLCGWVWKCTLRLRSRKHGRNLQYEFELLQASHRPDDCGLRCADTVHVIQSYSTCMQICTSAIQPKNNEKGRSVGLILYFALGIQE